MRLETFGIPICIAAFATFWSMSAMSSRPPMCERGVYSVELERAIDGDTVEAHIDLGFGLQLRRQSIRLHGVDTPEVHGPKRCRDMVHGPKASAFTQAWLEAHGGRAEIVVRDEREKHGRVVADVYPVGGGQSLSSALHEAGHHVDKEPCR